MLPDLIRWTWGIPICFTNNRYVLLFLNWIIITRKQKYIAEISTYPLFSYSTAGFDSCVNQLNATLCPEHKKLYGLWFPPNCTAEIQDETGSDESARTSDVTRAISTLIDTVTSIQPKITESSSRRQSKSQTEGPSSSAYILGKVEIWISFLYWTESF